ncbi:MarR family winged helix-turn-helix transcriptional regulator [Oricola sp.]|jgi:DNA-binding MarR family transcriptional regulator|uniref:MarR family winged helix-turn-helix transcriptional regulator n=1 Tax=Oricola sp. TaxID=1979950 RepID=UPI00320C015F|nr:MarR family transcriptional regulator [Oricola sp.]
MDDKDGKTQPAGADTAALPFEESVGYQVRQTHRLLQRYLQRKIEPYGVTPGMWYFLRALWDRDGMTQRELSLVVGTMEPTTLTAIKAMERSGLVRRVKNADDRRKINIFLTRRGQALRAELMPLAKEVVGNAVANFSEEEKSALLNYLKAVQENLSERMEADMMTAK